MTTTEPEWLFEQGVEPVSWNRYGGTSTELYTEISTGVRLRWIFDVFDEDEIGTPIEAELGIFVALTADETAAVQKHHRGMLEPVRATLTNPNAVIYRATGLPHMDRVAAAPFRIPPGGSELEFVGILFNAVKAIDEDDPANRALAAGIVAAKLQL